MLAGRPDVLHAMATNGTRLIIIGKDQLYSDMPEYRRIQNPAYFNERVRGTGGFRVTSFGEENRSISSWIVMTTKASACMNSAIPSTPLLAAIDPAWRGRLRQNFSRRAGEGPLEKRLRRLQCRRVLG